MGDICLYIFIKNERRVSILETESFGKLAYIEVGATCVGKIVQSFSEDNPFKKGDEKGYFSNREHVAVFKRSESAAIIWKQWFTKAQGEFVAEMVLVNQKGKYLVDHAMVF